MNIDKRYVELLADVAPAKTNKWLPRMAFLGLLAMVIGFGMILNALFSPVSDTAEESQAVIKLWEGVGVGGASLVLTGAASLLKGRERKRNRNIFIKYYEDNNAFPPWPEEDKTKPSSNTRNA